MFRGKNDESASDMQEFSSLRDLYYKSSQGFLIVYSITDRNSFPMISDTWEQILRVKDVDRCPAIIVGNKSDLEAK